MSGLPAGWRFASPMQANRHPELKASCGSLVPVRLKDRFRFQCVMVGDCCQHPDAGCKHIHLVGGIFWGLKDGMWRCPFLQADNSCGTYETRPVPCRMFPLGLTFEPENRLIVLYKQVPPQRCLPCYAGRTNWSVGSWLEANGMWSEIQTRCARFDSLRELAGHG